MQCTWHNYLICLWVLFGSVHQSLLFSPSRRCWAPCLLKKLIEETEHHNSLPSPSNYRLSLTKARLFENKQDRSFDKLYHRTSSNQTTATSKLIKKKSRHVVETFIFVGFYTANCLIHFMELTEHFELVSKSSPRSWKWCKLWKKRKPHRKLCNKTSFVDALQELKLQTQTKVIGRCHWKNQSPFPNTQTNWSLSTSSLEVAQFSSPHRYPVWTSSGCWCFLHLDFRFHSPDKRIFWNLEIGVDARHLLYHDE